MKRDTRVRAYGVIRSVQLAQTGTGLQSLSKVYVVEDKIYVFLYPAIRHLVEANINGRKPKLEIVTLFEANTYQELPPHIWNHVHYDDQQLGHPVDEAEFMMFQRLIADNPEWVTPVGRKSKRAHEELKVVVTV